MTPRKARLRLVAIVFAAVLLFVSCSGRNPDEADAAGPDDPTASLPARFKVQEAVPKPDFSVAAQSPDFRQAIKDAVSILETEPKKLYSPAENEEVKGGVSFSVPKKKAEAVLRKVHTDFLARGFYIFRYEQNLDLTGEPDKIGLLPTTDPYAVMAAMDTNGDNYSIATHGVIAWMKELQQEHPFILTGIGYDYMEGHFTRPIEDPGALAKRMYEFCPDIVDQGVSSVSELARELQKGTLYFWWD
jgi:hypothetical protein